MKRHVTYPFLFSLLSAILLPLLGANAQSVGVVMSGGGAKGLYHIGVLQALEENGIPIDYVSGTSMGSIIAGLYAAGYSPAEMREIVASGEVRQWVSGRIDPNNLPYYRRQSAQAPVFFTVRLNLKERPDEPNTARFKLPAYLISSTQIDLALADLFAPASAAAGGDFDRLMVPFLCVASDMNARRPVVLRRGDLGEAIRSSMSIPMAFKPMKMDSMLLYDGGIHDNFPWKPLDAAFRPDFLIGSKCTAGNTAVDADSPLTDQAFMLAMGITDYDLPEERSVMIARAVNVGMLDFNNAEAIIESGYRDALEQIPALRERIARTLSPEEAQHRREEFRAQCPPLVLDDYRIEGLSAPQTAYVRDLMRLDRTYDRRQRQMSFGEFRSKLFSVLCSGDYTAEYPRFRYDPAHGRYSVDLRMAASEDFRFLVGGNISSTVFNQAFIGFDYHTVRRVSQRAFAGLYLGPTYLTSSIGGRTDFFLWKPFSLEYAYNFEAQNLRHGNFGNITPVDKTESVKTSEHFLSASLTKQLPDNSLLALQINGGQQNYRYYEDRLPDPRSTADLTRLLFFGIKPEIVRNTLDKPLYPRRGSEISLSAIYVTGCERSRPYAGASRNIHREWFGARVQWKRYFDVPGCRWFSFGLDADAIWSNHPDLRDRTATLLSLPAYQPVVHSQMAFMPDYRAKRFVAGGVMPTFDLMPNFFLRTGFYAMLRDNRTLPGRSMQYIVETSLVYHTPIGPVSLSLTKYDLSSRNNMYLTFNFGYAIFAPNGHFY